MFKFLQECAGLKKVVGKQQQSIEGMQRTINKLKEDSEMHKFLIGDGQRVDGNRYHMTCETTRKHEITIEKLCEAMNTLIPNKKKHVKIVKKLPRDDSFDLPCA